MLAIHKFVAAMAIAPVVLMAPGVTASLCSVTDYMVEPFAGDCSVAQTCLQFLAHANWMEYVVCPSLLRFRRVVHVCVHLHARVYAS